jgi:hypothetical protein
MFKRIALVAAVSSSLVSSAAAQEPGQLGFVIQTPAAAGVMLNLSRGIALRPDVNFTRSSSSAGGDGTTWIAGISAPLYMSDADNLRTYVSPRFSYTRSTFDALGTTNTQTSTSFSASYGVQWAALKRLHFFGEVGPQYSKTSTATNDSDVWGLRSSLGLVLYANRR